MEWFWNWAIGMPIETFKQYLLIAVPFTIWMFISFGFNILKEKYESMKESRSESK